MRLEYQLAAVGEADLKRALRTVEAEVERNARRSVASDRRRAQSATRTARQTESAQVRATQKAEREAERAATRERRTREREAKRSADERIRQERRVAREQERLLKWRQGVQNRYWNQVARDHQKAERAEQRARQTSARSFQRGVARTTRGTAGALGRGLFFAGSAVGLGGGFAAANALGSEMRERAMASQLANQAGNPNIKGQLIREAQSVRGLSGEEALAGLTSFTDLTGDLETARRLLKDMAMFSHATGASFEDSAAMAGNFANSLKHIEDPAEKAAAILAAMYGAGGAAQKGAVEVKNLASQGGRITAIAGRFSGDKVNALQTASVLTQVAMTKSGTPEEAVTAASNFVDMLGTKTKEIEQLGIKGAFTKDSEGNVTSINDPLRLIEQVFERTNGDLGTMTKIFGQRGQRVIEGFRGAYEANGTQGIRDQFSELFDAKLSAKDVKTRAESRLSDPDLKLKDFATRFNAQVGRELIPVLERLIPEFEKMLPHIVTAVGVFGRLAQNLIDSPLSSIGTIIVGKVTADIVAARVGEGIKSALTSSITGGGSSGGGSSSSKGGLNLGGAVANGLTIGAAAGLTIYASGVVNFQASDARIDRAGGMLQEARGLDLTTVAGRERLSEIRRSMQDMSAENSEATTWERFLGWSTTPLGTDAAASAEKGKRLNAEVFGQRNAAESGSYKAFEAELNQMLKEAGRLQLEAARRNENAASANERASENLNAMAPPNRTTGLSTRGS